ncbi:helix-turn-helix transcriptional regulator [Hungatella effluvii]|uniref:helix-turn-helix transcriptional regulator n=2 Tax=Hungatella effluvii TaxID=1096246 RepID=UPI002A82895C|nr:helix-turn-helix transcriptional regulator [Hungatella effluvii]
MVIVLSPLVSALHQYILNQRISQANYYLSETSLSIKEIAQKLGYHDSHNFMKIYKRETGLTPSEYRNSLQHCQVMSLKKGQKITGYYILVSSNPLCLLMANHYFLF